MKGKRKALSALVVSLIAALLIFIPVMSAPQVAEAADDVVEVIIDNIEYKQEAARKQLDLLNAWRAKRPGYKNRGNVLSHNGEDTYKLIYDYTLEKIAMERAAELVISNAHDRPVGNRTVEYPKGYSVIAKAENLASTASYLSTDNEYAYYTLNMLKEEERSYDGQGHRRAMLGISWDFNAIGISIVKYKGVTYCVQIIGDANKIDTNKTPALTGICSRTVKLKKDLFKYQRVDDYKARIVRYDWLYDADDFGNATYTKIFDYIDVKTNLSGIKVKTENGIKKTYLGSSFYEYTGLAKENGTWYYFTNGVYNQKYVGTPPSTADSAGQFFVKNGKWDQSYTGLAYSSKDKTWYYVTNGRHDKKYIGTSSSTENPSKQYFVRNGVWDTSYTGLAKNRFDGKWYYMENGRHNTTYLGTSPSTQNPDKQYFVRNGFWDTSYTGLAKYGKNGKWYYMNKGTIDTSYIGISPSTQCPDKLFFVKGGVWETSYTGLAKYNKDGKWYYMKQGRFDNTFTGVSSSTQNPNSLFYVKGGLWQNTYNGTVKINEVTYNIKSGKVI